ncbi:beta-ketoadipate enol-lactone hydrolase [Coprinopsis sp. MPI-PUGE-AT-0042]|nr:beta-ketoadipate enol-lactone hydrolase [Coprinopsis sp. MPI-PUGE-AT-0042]
MASSAGPGSKSRLLPGRIPPPGEDPVADAIRERRGARGITPLDANLLHFPAGAAGYNQLLGALRDKGKLGADLRELIMLRIAALNNAAYEWIQHEPIGRKAGLTTGQLYAIRDVETPLPSLTPSPSARSLFSPLLLAGLHFTDALTLVSLPHSSILSTHRHPSKPQGPAIDFCLAFKEKLRSWASAKFGDDSLASLVDDLYGEATMLAGTYNLVSRFLVGSDVNGLGDAEVPWPVKRVTQYVEVPSYPGAENKATHKIYAVTLRHRQREDDTEDIPWLVLSNSLLTSTKMWGWVVPYLLDGGSLYGNGSKRYNILLHDQRGHGLSTLPSSPPPTASSSSRPENDVGYGDDDSTRLTTIPLLAWDIQNVLTAPQITKIIDGDEAKALKPIHALIGVSQGGACALAFSALYPFTGQESTTTRTTRAVVSCDTGPKTPAGNREAWRERVELVLGSSTLSSNLEKKTEVAVEYGEKIGLGKLSDVTVPRWFPSGSPISASARKAVEEMVETTPVRGFVEGARALGGYDLLSAASDSKDTLDVKGRPALFESEIEKVLLLAGSLDGNGKVAQGLESLKKNWDEALGKSGGEHKTLVEFVRVEDAGHLPMVDRPDEWCEVVGQWLANV